MTGFGLTDLDAVIDQLSTSPDERPLPSGLLARREACRTARHILKRDPTTTSRLAVPLARTLADTIDWPASDNATAVFNLNRIRNDIQRTATSALAELDAWRLCIDDQPQIGTVLSILSPLAIPSDLPDDIVTVVAAIFERACIYAPDAVQSALDPQYLVSNLASSQSNRDPSRIHPARFQLLVALLHAAPSTRTVDGVKDILEIARSAVDPVVASRTALAAALPSLDYPDDDDDVIARCCEAIPAVTWDAAEGTVTSPSHISKEDPTENEDPTRDDIEDDDVEDDESGLTPPREVSRLFDDDGATNDGDGDDDTDDTGSSADEVEPFVRVLGLLVASDRVNKKLSDSAFTVLLEATHTLREPHFHASGDSDDNVDETLSINRFSKFVEISHSRTEQVFHELGIMAATNILSESQRNALTGRVLESIVDTEFFDVFKTEANGWTLPLVEHTNPRPAALSDDTGDISASSAIPLLLRTDLITDAHFEAAIRDLWTRIQSVDNIRDAADELRIVGHLASHDLLPSADANRILADIHRLLNGDVDDTKRALKAIQYLAGSGIFDSEHATPLVEALFPLLDPQTADLANESGQALSHLITAEVIQSVQINNIAATIFDALESGSGPVVRGATRTAAALTATGALSTERAADLFGYLVQLVTVKVDQTGTSEAIIHAGAAHALQGFAGNYDIPAEHIDDVLSALAIAAHGSNPAYGVNQGQRAALVAFHDIIKETDIPDIDESILMPVLEVAVAQLQPDSQFETEPPDSELSRTAAQILRTLVDELLLDPLLLAGVLSIDPQDVTWIKNYPPDVIRVAARADLRRYLAPDNTTTAVLLQAVATAAASDPMPFDGARGQLLHVLRAAAPTAEVKIAGIGVLLELSDRATTQNQASLI